MQPRPRTLNFSFKKHVGVESDGLNIRTLCESRDASCGCVLAQTIISCFCEINCQIAGHFNLHLRLNVARCSVAVTDVGVSCTCTPCHKNKRARVAKTCRLPTPGAQPCHTQSRAILLQRRGSTTQISPPGKRTLIWSVPLRPWGVRLLIGLGGHNHFPSVIDVVPLLERGQTTHTSFTHTHALCGSI